MRYQRARFELRFYRGLASPVAASEDDCETFVERVCVPCGGVFKTYPSIDSPVCFDCKNESNPFSNIRCSIEAEGEDVTIPQRVREGTAGINLGLRGFDVPVGKRPDGSVATEYRPITHNELPSFRKRREYAKQTGMTVIEPMQKRAVG